MRSNRKEISREGTAKLMEIRESKKIVCLLKIKPSGMLSSLKKSWTNGLLDDQVFILHYKPFGKDFS